MRKVISVSVDTKEDSDILEYLSKTANKSQAIKDAIRDKMQHKEFTPAQIELIKDIIISTVGNTTIPNDNQFLANAINDCLNDF